MEQIRNGDEKAFERFFNEHWHLLFTFARKLLKSYDDAQDVVQLVCISIWERRAQLNIEGPLQAYLLQAVRFQSLKRLKEIMSKPENLDFVRENYLPAFNAIWDKLDQTDFYRELDARLGHLPPKTREIFLLSRRHHFSIAEIAGKLNLSEKTIRNQLHIALKELRHHIALAIIFSDILS